MTDKKTSLENASNAHLAEAFRRLTGRNPELAEAANAELSAIAQEVVQKANAAAHVEATHQRQLTPEQAEKLINTIMERCKNNNVDRHRYLDALHLQAHLERKAVEKPEKLWSLNEMERTGGEPAALDYDKERDEYIFWDFSEETPEGRRDVCYDHHGEREAISHGWRPKGNAVDMAAAMGIEMLTPEEYRTLQKFKNVDVTTFSWLETPEKTRKYGDGLLGGGDEGPDDPVAPSPADEYFDERGFRSSLRI